MNANEFVNQIEVIASIMIFIWFFYGPWQSFVVDTVRQNLFEMRDKLFLMAANGNVSFESGEYKFVREKLNMFIRYAHAATWTHLLSILICDKNKAPDSSFDIETVTSAMSDRILANAIKGFYRDAVVMIAVALVVRSLFLLIAMMITLPVTLVFSLFDAARTKRFVSSSARILDRDARLSDTTRFSIVRN